MFGILLIWNRPRIGNTWLLQYPGGEVLPNRRSSTGSRTFAVNNLKPLSSKDPPFGRPKSQILCLARYDTHYVLQHSNSQAPNGQVPLSMLQCDFDTRSVGPRETLAL
jgi:hypothetical protein